MADLDAEHMRGGLRKALFACSMALLALWVTGCSARIGPAMATPAAAAVTPGFPPTADLAADQAQATISAGRQTSTAAEATIQAPTSTRTVTTPVPTVSPRPTVLLPTATPAASAGAATPAGPTAATPSTIGATPAPSTSPAPRTAPEPALPPENPTLGQEWVRSTDGSVMVYVPAGEFLMGSTREAEPCAYEDDMPRHTVYLDGYWIARYEVTNHQFARFVQDTGYRAEGDWKAASKPDGELLPVVNVSWNDATAYAKWAGGALPTEAQWEKAARGADARVYPWGNSWVADAANVGRGGGPAPVGSYAGDQSPYGCYDMAGNVMEWVRDRYGKYSAERQANPLGPPSGNHRMLRGANFLNAVGACNARCAARNAYFSPRDAVPDVGFRTVSAPAATGPEAQPADQGSRSCGNLIAYLGKDEQLWGVGSDGKNPRRLTTMEPTELPDHPSGFPDGRRIAFTTHFTVFIVHVDGGGLTKMPYEYETPAISPDGRRIVGVDVSQNRLPGGGQAFVTDNLVIRDADGGNPINLTGSTRADPCSLWKPAWSPDGSQIAFQARSLIEARVCT